MAMCPRILKLSKFSQDDGMAEMEIGAAGIAAQFYVERSIVPYGPLNFFGELFFRDYFLGAALNNI